MLSFGALRSAFSKCLVEGLALGRTALCAEKATVTSVCASFHSSATWRRSDSSLRFTTGYEGVKELLQADSQVQQIFSLDMANQREHNKTVIADTISQLQARPGDTGSTSVQIAVLTFKIKYLTDHVKKNRKDYSSLRSLVQLVHQRRKLLLYLKRTHFQDYIKIVSELNLRHPVIEKYPKKSVSQQNRAAQKQKKKKTFKTRFMKFTNKN